MTTGLRAAKAMKCTGMPPARPGWRPNLISMRWKAKVQWAELIGRVASQEDQEAFRTLFEYFAPRIKGFLVKRGCTADEADELAQATLIAVWRKAAQFDPKSAGAAAWIFTIARNLRIDLARRSARGGSMQPEAALESEPDPAASVEATLSRVEETSRVAAAVARLPEEQAAVIRMSYIDERPHPEIAAALGIPLGTVKSRIRLAMNRLRDLLDELK